MKKGQWGNGILGLLVLWATVLLWPPAVRAQDDLAQLKAELEAQKQQQAELQDRINQLEARQRLKEKALAEKIEEMAAQPAERKGAEIPDVLKWASKLHWFGDFRYRYETIDDDTKDDERHRNRIRARLGLDVTVTDEWDLGLRIATGQGESGGDPVSTNQTLGESFSNKPVWIDLAFFDYHPQWMEGLSVLGGKIENPFYRAGKSQLIWDSDLTPEGGAVRYGLPLGEQTTASVVAGGFWVAESSSSTDTSLWGVQAFLQHQFAKTAYVLGGASLYCYGNIQGKEALSTQWDDASDFFGNTHTTVGGKEVYAGDYDLFEAFIEFGTELAGIPVLAFGDWVQNTVAVNPDEDTGWLIGATVNKAKKPGSWQFDYDYRDIELDAVVGQFNDSDFIGGGTGGKGHRFSFGYVLANNVATGVTYFLDEYSGRKDDADYDRLQVDLQLKF